MNNSLVVVVMSTMSFSFFDHLILSPDELALALNLLSQSVFILFKDICFSYPEFEPLSWLPCHPPLASNHSNSSCKCNIILILRYHLTLLPVLAPSKSFISCLHNEVTVASWSSCDAIIRDMQLKNNLIVDY